METAQVVIRNKGTRTYRLADGPGGVRRELEPSRTLAVSEEEAKQHLNYHDIEDAAQAVPENAKMIDELRAENARLRAERDRQAAHAQGVTFAPTTDTADVPRPPVPEMPVPQPLPEPKAKRKGR